jgi:hypothetical protein
MPRRLAAGGVELLEGQGPARLGRDPSSELLQCGGQRGIGRIEHASGQQVVLRTVLVGLDQLILGQPLVRVFQQLRHRIGLGLPARGLQKLLRGLDVVGRGNAVGCVKAIGGRGKIPAIDGSARFAQQAQGQGLLRILLHRDAGLVLGGMGLRLRRLGPIARLRKLRAEKGQPATIDARMAGRLDGAGSLVPAFLQQRVFGTRQQPLALLRDPGVGGRMPASSRPRCLFAVRAGSAGVAMRRRWSSNFLTAASVNRRARPGDIGL